MPIQKTTETMLMSSILSGTAFLLAALFILILINLKVKKYTVGHGIVLALLHASILIYFASLPITNLMLYFTITLKLKFLVIYRRLYLITVGKSLSHTAKIRLT